MLQITDGGLDELLKWFPEVHDARSIRPQRVLLEEDVLEEIMSGVLRELHSSFHINTICATSLDLRVPRGRPN